MIALKQSNQHSHEHVHAHAKSQDKHSIDFEVHRV